jgi:hypothetical protein
LGYYGSEIGDVFFAHNPGLSWGILPSGADIVPSLDISTNGGAQIPTGDSVMNSNLGVLFASRPNI